MLRPRRRPRPLRLVPVRAPGRLLRDVRARTLDPGSKRGGGGLPPLDPIEEWSAEKSAAYNTLRGCCRVRVAIAGSSGSIGTQTLDVIRSEPDRFEVVALGVGCVARRAGRAGHTTAPALRGHRRPVASGRGGRRGAVRHGRRRAGRPRRRRRRRRRRRCRLRRAAGDRAHAECRQALGPCQQGEPHRRRTGRPAVAGDPRRRAGARWTASTARSTSACGPRTPGRRGRPDPVDASGGPFRGRRAAELADVGVDEALAHPTWQMGPKITIDSSTLMNKDSRSSRPTSCSACPTTGSKSSSTPQSIVHSMVEFTDGSTIAQLSNPDMRLPIGYALAYPERIATPFRAHRLVTARPSRLRATRRRDVPLPRPGLRGQGRRAAARRPGSARRTKSPSRRSWPGRSDGTRLLTCATGPSTGMI